MQRTEGEPDGWEGDRLEELFFLALEEPESQRKAYCMRLAGDDAGFRDHLEFLLAEHGAADDGFLWELLGNCELDSGSFVTPPRDGTALEELRTAAEPVLPDAVGRYRILRRLGQGGMGTVYLAEQSRPIRRLVALKTLPIELADPERIARLRAEQQALALLDHPNIARIYDGGETDAGFPYFVMEYVPEGASIVAYARGSELSRRALLELFAEACDAVEYGHGKGVLHRDLKPGNILVTSEGRPKVIDYGVARTVDEGLDDTTRCTRTGEVLGTVGYLSPEQCRGENDLIGPRSDVYALGVVLYELLTGESPYSLAGKPVYVALRMIEEVRPTRPSKHDVSLKGPLETILLTALEKLPERRYASAAALARDIRSHLASEPIAARRPTLLRYATVGAVGAVVLTTYFGWRLDRVEAAPVLEEFGVAASMRYVRITSGSAGFTGELDEGDLFGSGLASIGDLDGDGLNDLAVGAAWDDDGGRDRGAAWILFMNADGTVRAHAKISSTSGGLRGPLADGDDFGSGMASLGDLDGDGVVDLAVGAAGSDDGHTDSGAIWVLFLRPDGSVAREQKIATGHAGLEVSFVYKGRVGSGLAALGDLDGDGVVDLAVGASRDRSPVDRGALWILYLRRDGTVHTTRELRSGVGLDPEICMGTGFGLTVAGPGDLDGDGIPDLIAGSAYDDGTDKVGEGAFYVLFLRRDGSIRSHRRIGASEVLSEAGYKPEFAFGGRVSAVGDLDGDGRDDLAVGVLQGGAPVFGGALWLGTLDRAGRAVRGREIGPEETAWLADALKRFGQFGEEIESLGDLDGDGFPELAVGSARHDSEKPRSGAVYVLFLEEAGRQYWP